MASGVRRIEAITGRATLECMRGNCCTINAGRGAEKPSPGELREAMQEIQEIRELRHMVDAFKARDAMGEAGASSWAPKDVGGLKVLTATLNDAGRRPSAQDGRLPGDKDLEAVWPVPA